MARGAVIKRKRWKAEDGKEWKMERGEGERIRKRGRKCRKVAQRAESDGAAVGGRQPEEGGVRLETSSPGWLPIGAVPARDLYSPYGGTTTAPIHSLSASLSQLARTVPASARPALSPPFTRWR